MKTTPVKGTNDYLPKQAELRDYLKDTILKVYKENGFRHISTPAIEDAENLSKSEGGENLNLIFNILKRGEKLESVLKSGVSPENTNQLFDLGLRYDLTLPLSRYYANNQNDILLPFKCIQTDRVYRAERPQRGRLREFIQCDIDIIGQESSDAEIELILTTVKALEAIGISGCSVRINDRKLLCDVLLSFGFKQDDLESVCITFDKMDKVGIEGVCDELEEKGFESSAISSFKSFLDQDNISLETVIDLLDDKLSALSVQRIIDDTAEISSNKINPVFDLSLVRGQGYYTGTVFEIVSKDFSGSVAGGGRYDKLIGKFLNKDIPAVGFSIGFERIYAILSEQNKEAGSMPDRIAVLYDSDGFKQACILAERLRQNGSYVCLFERPKKTSKFLDRLKDQGYNAFVLVGEKEEVQPL